MDAAVRQHPSSAPRHGGELHSPAAHHAHRARPRATSLLRRQRAHSPDPVTAAAQARQNPLLSQKDAERPGSSWEVCARFREVGGRGCSPGVQRPRDERRQRVHVPQQQQGEARRAPPSVHRTAPLPARRLRHGASEDAPQFAIVFQRGHRLGAGCPLTRLRCPVHRLRGSARVRASVRGEPGISFSRRALGGGAAGPAGGR